jgi:hypothetical protein
VGVLVAGKYLGSTLLNPYANYGAIVEVPLGETTVHMSLINKGVPANGKTMTDPGQRFVYLRFVDGAGNASAKILMDTATLNPNYLRPTLYLPAIMR